MHTPATTAGDYLARYTHVQEIVITARASIDASEPDTSAYNRARWFNVMDNVLSFNVDSPDDKYPANVWSGIRMAQAVSLRSVPTMSSCRGRHASFPGRRDIIATTSCWTRMVWSISQSGGPAEGRVYTFGANGTQDTRMVSMPSGGCSDFTTEPSSRVTPTDCQSWSSMTWIESCSQRCRWCRAIPKRLSELRETVFDTCSRRSPRDRA
jgi:hypothetical protein